MYKNVWMISEVFSNFNTTLLWSHVHCRKSLTCLEVAVVVWWVGGGVGTLRVVSLHVGLTGLWGRCHIKVMNWVFKHYTTLSYICTCMQWWSSDTPSCGYQRRAHSLSRAGYHFDRQREAFYQRWIHLGLCYGVDHGEIPDQSSSACVHMNPSHRLEVRGTTRREPPCGAFPVCEVGATSKLCIGYWNITQHLFGYAGRWLS
jgi:hypothetical protein